MTLLIIDGSDIIIQRLAFLITESESNNISAVHSAVTYADATALLLQIKPDVVLLDMHLPGLQSPDLLKLIKKNNTNSALIILVNYANAVTKEKYRWVGADFVFDKYNDFEKIPIAIDAIAAKMIKAI
jgi:DNA-binding NarL/FixJ family response regulator